MKQTSDRMSGIAARMIKLKVCDIATMSKGQAAKMVGDIRSLAASVLAQDEHKGKRK